MQVDKEMSTERMREICGEFWMSTDLVLGMSGIDWETFETVYRWYPSLEDISFEEYIHLADRIGFTWIEDLYERARSIEDYANQLKELEIRERELKENLNAAQADLELIPGAKQNLKNEIRNLKGK